MNLKKYGGLLLVPIFGLITFFVSENIDSKQRDNMIPYFFNKIFQLSA